MVDKGSDVDLRHFYFSQSKENELKRNRVKDMVVFTNYTTLNILTSTSTTTIIKCF